MQQFVISARHSRKATGRGLINTGNRPVPAAIWKKPVHLFSLKWSVSIARSTMAMRKRKEIMSDEAIRNREMAELLINLKNRELLPQ
ncbi:hypothetical protein NAE50_001956 [Salmonella enterica]|nr:hypothetical protein [Salmonella enterica]ELX2843828.1 hypothetical protein [Salmonella enterica]